MGNNGAFYTGTYRNVFAEMGYKVTFKNGWKTRLTKCSIPTHAFLKLFRMIRDILLIQATTMRARKVCLTA